MSSVCIWTILESCRLFVYLIFFSLCDHSWYLPFFFSCYCRKTMIRRKIEWNERKRQRIVQCCETLNVNIYICSHNDCHREFVTVFGWYGRCHTSSLSNLKKKPQLNGSLVMFLYFQFAYHYLSFQLLCIYNCCCWCCCLNKSRYCLSVICLSQHWHYV